MISQAITILLVGMITVFFILWLIMLAGKYLILLTNHFSKEIQAKKPTHPETVIDARKLAAISAAVVNITNGIGKVERIQKIN
jgi:oxaloacetate decarboxylase gamma subunit